MSVSKPRHGSHHTDRPARGSSNKRRTALELARIYVSSSAHTAALEVLDGIPVNGWDEEARLLRAECLIGMGSMAQAQRLLGPLLIPGGKERRQNSNAFASSRRKAAKRSPSDSASSASREESDTKTRGNLDRLDPDPDPDADRTPARVLLPRVGNTSKSRNLSRRERFGLWRFLLQLRILHRTGRYREVLQIGRAFFGQEAYRPSLLLARIATVMAQSMMTLQRPAEARDVYEQVLDIYRGFRSREGIADTLLGIANTHLLDCHWDEADAVYQECRYRYEELGHTSKALACLINLGVLRVKRGDFVSGRNLLLQGLARANQAGEARRLVTIHLGLAMADMRTGAFGSARRNLLLAVKFARRAQNRRGVSLALEFLGELHLATGQTVRARRCLEIGLAFARKRGGDADIAFEIHRRLAQVALAENRLSHARTFVTLARHGAQVFGDAYESAAIDRVHAEIEEAEGRLPHALELVRRAAPVLDRLGETHERALLEIVTLRLEHRLGHRTHQALQDRLQGIRQLHDENPESPILRKACELEGCVSQHVPRFELSEPAQAEEQDHVRETSKAASGGLTDGELALAESFGLVSQSPEFLAMLSLARQIAPHSTPVLVLGEPGSGRGLVARLIHAWSKRSGIYAPFHCSPLPGDVLATELFGATHANVDHTGGLINAASRGTVFFDDITQLPVAVQAELLKWFEEKETHQDREESTRVICAAQAHSLRLSLRFGGSGNLREDLYNRLARVILEVPPLRDRLDDLPEIIQLMLQQGAQRLGIPVPSLPAHVLERFQHRAWPGNLVELRQEVELFLQHHRRDHTNTTAGSTARSRPRGGRSAKFRSMARPTSKQTDTSPTIVEAEVNDALCVTGWNLAAAARELGVSRSALYRFLKRHGIERPTV